MKNILQEDNLVFKITVLLIVLALVILSAICFYVQHINKTSHYLIPSFILFVAGGLFYIQVWARLLFVVGYWLFIIGFYVNPFALHDLSHVKQGYSSTTHLITYFPCVVIGLWALHIFGKHRHKFYFIRAQYNT